LALVFVLVSEIKGPAERGSSPKRRTKKTTTTTAKELSSLNSELSDTKDEARQIREHLQQATRGRR
jgi:predicted  nucleic acid-binding Zn-ribbon protein